MKKNLELQWVGAVCLLAVTGLGGTVAVTPASKTYVQTELTVGTPVTLPITLSGWGNTNLSVSANGGGAIFSSSVVPSGDASQATDRTLSLTPLGQAGDTTVIVTVNGSGFSPVSAEVSLSVIPVPVLSGLQTSVSFNEDTTFTDPFSVTYWGKENDLSWNATITAGSAVLQTATINGSGLSRSLVLTPRPNKNGSASVTVIVGDGTRAATQAVAVTVSPISDPPVVTGLPSPLSFNEDTTTNHVFTVTDPDEGQSGAIASSATVIGSPTTLLSSASVSGSTLQLVPYENAYGWVTVRVVTANSVVATTNNVLVKVLPVADASAVSPWPTAAIELSVGGMPYNQIFTAVSVTDADHLAFKNGTSNEFLKASVVVSAANVQFSSGGNGSSTTNLAAGSIPSGVATWVKGLSLYPPESTYAPVGNVSTNTLTLRVYGFGSNDTLSVTKTVPVLLINPNHPPHFIPSVSPSSMQEGQTITPFAIDQLIDQDAVHTAFSLRLLLKPGDAALAALSSTGTMQGNESELNMQLRNVGLAALNGVMSTPTTNVTVFFLLSDSIDTVTNSATITINQIATAPVINGINELTSYYSINDTETLVPFPRVITYDTDQGGQQWLRASVSVNNPAFGSFTYLGSASTGFFLQAQSDLQAALRQLVFEPNAGALPIGTSGETTLTLTVIDATGISTVNSMTRVLIAAVNKPPVIKVPQVQPVLLPPHGDLRPFVGTTVTNDDLGSVTLTITLDEGDKGALENLGGFTYVGGAYTITGTVDAINASLTNLTYAVNPQYVFPSDDPGGTYFTLEAEDYQIKLGSAQVWVQIQDEPRNHLVTKAANDGTPGSLLFVLAHAGNNDVITFALPEYPAVIRVPEAFGPLVLSTSLTLKGPGADLLTISGDGDGNEVADGQIFVVQSRVTIEGVALSQGHATFGGAVSVAETGALTLRACAVVDCVAEEYGGAIDVEGELLLEGCYLARNRVTGSGFGGGAVSFYSSHDSSIVNTTFASNRLDNSGGYGGGAVYVERDEAPINVAVTHCTFAGNADASDKASAVFVVGGNSYATLRNNVFSDYSAQAGARNIDVTGEGWIVSEGGNVCDDSTRTAYQQAGGTSVYLLTHSGDTNNVSPGLGSLTQAKGDTTPAFPLQAGSPALRRAQDAEVSTDQRGRIRRFVPRDSGAVQQDATERVVVTEIQFSQDVGISERFIELYVPRDSSPVNLAGCGLYVNGALVHRFAEGLIINAGSAVFNSAPTSVVPGVAGLGVLIAPGNGVVVAFPENPSSSSLVASNNPTPVVGASVVTNAEALTALLAGAYPDRGTVSIKHLSGGASAPVVEHAFLSAFIDPMTETNRWAITGNSIATAPQAFGFAFLPHSGVSYNPIGGMDRPLNTATLAGVQSPGAWPDGTPFGLNNAFPLAVEDTVNLTEDDVGLFDVLSNDFDADGNDRLVIVDVSSTSGPGAGDVATTLSALGAAVSITPAGVPLRGTALFYDPRYAAALQALPVGVEILDTFYYESLDVGCAPVEEISEGTGSNTWIKAGSHRLNSGDSVILSGVSVPAYNGEYQIAVLDEHTFAISVPFAGAAAAPGIWETAGPRTPSSRSEASVTIRVTGVNDAPTVVGDVVTNVTESSRVRFMVRPDLADTGVSVAGDPVPPPVFNTSHLIDNDIDVDSDETWETLRVVGVMGAVHAILDYTGAPGESPVTIHSPSHGLVSGTEVLIANYGGHHSYNGYHTVTVLDDDTFTIPCFFVDNGSVKGVWVVLTESNRYQAVTDVGATVDLTLRADVREDHLVYDPSTSSFLNGLAEGELYTNRFYQAVVDSHGAIGIGPVDVVVVGLNDTPVVLPDPGGIGVLSPLVNSTNTLEHVLSEGLDILYTLPPASCTTGRIDVQALDRSGRLSGTLVLPDLWFTDEGTPIAIEAAALLANDADADRQDVLRIAFVDAFSREGAALNLSGSQIIYDPTAADALQALARDERVIDTFYATITDTMTGGTVTSLVAVLVVGVNDTPVAQPDAITLSEDDVFSFNPILHPADVPAQHDYDLDINGVLPDDRLTLVAVSNLITTGEARVDLWPLLAQYDATVSGVLNQLADWQTYTDSFDYVISDSSFLFVVDDEYYVPTNTVEKTLDVLANDRDFTLFASSLSIVDVGPTLSGGTVSIAPDGRHLVYSSPKGLAVDDFFRYVAENEVGNRRSARVLVRSVIPPVNGILCAANDRFAVAYGETAVLDVLANDNMLPAGGEGLVLATNVVETSIPGQPVFSGNAFIYTATNGLSPLVFTYEVSAGGTSVAQASVVVSVVDRRGTLFVQNDTLSVLADSVDNELTVLSNDNLITGATNHLRLAGLMGVPAFGTATVSASATALVYTPNPGFVGIEQLRYLATDGMGGTGTGVVTVCVGKVETAIDFFAVAATTNAAGVRLDVLANDLVQPFPTGALTLVSVSPANTAIGSMQVSGDGARLDFVPSNTVGQVDFVYLVSDRSARTATGTVSVATVPPGIYANTDRFLVRGGGAGYELNVLANDRSYPDVDKSYTILSVGTGAEAPNAGGSVSIVNNRLRYTPHAGFFGQERFTYVMSDSVATDSAWVTVTVSPGDLFANADRFGVFYEREAGSTNARPFTLPVVFNDRIQPTLGQTIHITGLGVGTNAPSRLGEVSIGADGVTLVYRPVEVPATSYVERFTYEISDGKERRASADVEVQVFNRENALVALTQDDAFTVARSSADNVLPLLGNDFAQPGTAGGWIITSVSATAFGGTVSISDTAVSYTPAAGFVGVDSFTYSVSDGLGGTGSAAVDVRVGALPTLPDRFAVVSGSVSNDLDVLANDVLTDAYAEEYTLASVFGATQGGTLELSAENTVLYAPSPAYSGGYPYTETFCYTVPDDAGGAVTGTVQVVVHEAGSDRSTTTVTVTVEGRNDRPVIQNVPPNVPITDKETAKPFVGVTIIEVDEQTLEAIDVVVSLDNAEKGVLENLGDFADLGGGRYALSGVTSAQATAQIRELVFVPTENRIKVPTTEMTRFTIVVTDNKSEPVSDTQTATEVTAVNDAPVITGTRAGQTVYAAMPIKLFSSVTLWEIDDLTLQPLAVTVRMSVPTNGALQNLGDFVFAGSGVYVATNITAAMATLQLRAMEYVFGVNRVAYGAPQLTVFQITVNDQFAPPVSDSQTSVVAYNSAEGMLQPTNTVLRTSFGHAVDACGEYAVVGAPEAGVNGRGSGVVLIYRLQPGTTNTWAAWRQLLPAGVGADDAFGCSVSMNGDLLAVGSYEDASSSGSVYLFQRDLGGSGNWGLLHRVAATNLPASSRFGFSVHLDGDVLAVGAPQATLSNGSPPEGAVLLYGRNQGGAGAWGEILRWEPFGQTSLDFGWSVALSGDRLVVGAPGDKAGLPAGTPKGAVYYLSRHVGGTNMWGLAQKIVATNFTTDVDFGSCVSVDGDVLAVGAPRATFGYSVEAGQVLVYGLQATSNAWQELTRLDRRNESEGLFGYSLSVNKDFIFIGAPDYVGGYTPLSFSGCAYLFRRVAGSSAVWSQLEKLRIPTGDSLNWQYGVAVNFQQDVAIVGVVKNETLLGSSVGAAYMYRFKFNNAPSVASEVPDQFAEWNQPFAYKLPDGIFADPDVGDELKLLLTLPAGGHGLSVVDTTVSGTPTALGPISAEACATDASGASVCDAFDIVVLLNGTYVEGTPRNMWNVEHFGVAVADPSLQSSVWGGQANGDGDTLDNDHEYAFGGNPTVGDAAGGVTITAGSGNQVIVSYVRRTNDPALSYVLQGTASLTPPDWQDVRTLVIAESVVAVGDTLETVRQTVSLEDAGSSMFFRVMVSP